MKPITGGYTRLEFNIPSRGLIGYRGEFMTDTKGNGIINTIFNGYAPYKGEIAYRKLGSLIAFETGESVTYGLFSAQDRGTLFIGPGEKVYAGHGHRFIFQSRGYRIECLQEKAPDQHAFLFCGRGTDSGSA